ncbi:MAG: oligosaccharide flippase family protein, partial [Gemmatimonadaceae bacterium]
MSERGGAALGNTMFSSLAVYAEYAAGLAISMIVARTLGPTAFGTYTLLMWFASVGVVLANHGITTGVMKFIGEARGQGDSTLARRALGHFERMQLRSCVAVCLVLGLAILLLSRRATSDVEGQRLLWVVLVAVAARACFVFYVSAAKGFENFRLTARVQGVAAPIGLALVVIAARGGATLSGFVVAYALGSLVYAVLSRVAFSRSLSASTRYEHDAELGALPVVRMRRHVAFASAIVLLEVLVLRQTEVLFLEQYSTSQNIAFYGIGRSLASSAMLLIPGVAAALLLPMMSRTFGADPALLGARFLAATRYMLLLAVPVVVAGEVFAADVITALYGAAYAPAILVFRITLAASAVGAVSASASSYQLGTDRQPAIVATMTGTAVITLLLDFILIRAYQLNGAIAAGAAGSVLLGAALL